MTPHRAAILLCLVGPLAACTKPDHVLFVTSTTIGINVDQKPPTASIAYDRVEGFIGPRYQNGALPAVVGSIETGGTVFNPKIRQVYATGLAAVKAVDTPNPPAGQTTLSGDPAQKKLTFFGTTTTIGLKAGFSADGYPDSFVFGYKRKEFSFIPLSSTTVGGVTTEIYPSVLASIDTTGTATSLTGTGLSAQQFFATGQAAETLATNPAISSAFKTISAESVTASLTEEERQNALALGSSQSEAQQKNLENLMAAVAPNGVLNRGALGELVDAANAQVPGSVPSAIKAQTDPTKVRQLLRDNQPAVQALVAALKSRSIGR